MSTNNNLLNSMFAAAKLKGAVSIGPVPVQKAKDSLEVLKENDPLFSLLVYKCDHSALYKFDINQKQWVNTNIAGHFYIYEREDTPKNALAIITKKEQAFIRPISTESRVEFKTPFVFVHSEDETLGFCFGDPVDTANVFQNLVSLTKPKVEKVKKATSALEAMFSKENRLKQDDPIMVTVEQKTVVKTTVKDKQNVLKSTKTKKIKFETEIKDLDDHNLRAIQAIDPTASGILAFSCHAMLYKYDIQNDKWDKTEVGGPFFLYHKNNSHNYSYMIANKQILEDLVQPIITEMRFENRAPYIMTNIPGKEISALWFGSEDDCHNIFNVLSTVKNRVDNTINAIDLHTMTLDDQKG